jgi:hypothetical protein
MAITVCPPGVWTSIPAPGLIEARGIGLYIDTSGTQPANPAEGYALASNEAMVTEASTVFARPAQDVKSAIVVTNPS